MGGGRNKFLPKNVTLSKHGNGSRLDEDLVQKWKDNKSSKNASAFYVTDVHQLQDLDTEKVDYLLGTCCELKKSKLS